MGYDLLDPLTLTRRRERTEKLLRAGLGIRQVARLTREHPSQVHRWKPKVWTPPKTSNPDKQGVPARLVGKSVNTPKNIFLANADGVLEPATFDHPVEHLEPVDAPDFDDNKTRRIQRAALRYVMQQEPRPMRTVATEIGCTSAAISRALNIISDKLGLKAPCQKSTRARAAYSERAKRLAAEGRGAKNQAPLT
ncbi:MAG: hypothetical protein LBK60_00415 [Verrucomicrobiales bacterium]|jgi:hypothetical protein|nr:hypothetical protein [Verrucomicrobiales bacterium]